MRLCISILGRNTKADFISSQCSIHYSQLILMSPNLELEFSDYHVIDYLIQGVAWKGQSLSQCIISDLMLMNYIELQL